MRSPLALLGLLALVACKDDAPAPAEPAGGSPSDPFGDYVKRSKVSEAKLNIERMGRDASAYFEEERPSPDGTGIGPRQCPNDGRPEGETGITPPLAVACAKAPGGKCTPGGSGAGGYDPKLWTENPVWSALRFEMLDPHFFHYNFAWKNDPSGQGKCQATAQAFGDLDGDGVYSTYERVTTIDEHGVSRGELRVENELE